MRVPEQFRLTEQRWLITPLHIPARLVSDESYGNNGAFVIPKEGKKAGVFFFAIASDKEGWEHVSVSMPFERRCPTWEEMCYIKNLFWTDDDVVVQYHPAKKDYVNMHPHTLHLWRPLNGNPAIPTPPPILVGF